VGIIVFLSTLSKLHWRGKIGGREEHGVLVFDFAILFGRWVQEEIMLQEPRRTND
jgi:hypothetical protein